MLQRSVSPALLPVALPGAAIALPLGGALDFGERLFASEPPVSPMCVWLPHSRISPCLQPSLPVEGIAGGSLLAHKTIPRVPAMPLKWPSAKACLITSVQCCARPRGCEVSLFTAASPFAQQPPRCHDPLRSPESLCEPSALGLAPSSLSSLLSSPCQLGPCQHSQVPAVVYAPARKL